MRNAVDLYLTIGFLFCKMITENTIIENTKGCFMGKMILDDLRKRLERLATDEDELRASILNDCLMLFSSGNLTALHGIVLIAQTTR